MTWRRSLTLAAAVAVGGGAPRLSAQSPAGPVIEPVFAASRDSDANFGFRVGLALDRPVGAGTRVGVEASRWQVEDGVDRVRSYALWARGTFRPVPVIRIEAAAGGSVLDPSGAARTEAVIPTGRLRARWRHRGGAALDVRARRGLLDASPELLANRVIRSELGAALDLPVVALFKVRGVGRVTELSDRLDRNTRTAAGGMVVLAVAPTVELSGQVHRVAYDHFSTAGYFAPRQVQVAQVGSYGELERGPVTVAYDVAAGAQRIANHGAALGHWGRALSFWSQVGWLVRPGAELRLELEFYDSPAAAVAAGAGWKYGSASVSLRQSL